MAVTVKIITGTYSPTGPNGLAILACMIIILIVCLCVGRSALRGCSHKLSISETRTPQGRIALVLVGTPPLGQLADYRIKAWLDAASWPASVVCYAVLTALDTAVPLHPLQLLSSSTCDLAVVVPWDIDPGAEWDESLHPFMSSAEDVCYSFCVPGCERLHYRRRVFKDCAYTPQLVVPSQNRALRIPDFRCALGRPALVASYAQHWFPSFFAGLLMYPAVTALLSMPPQSSAIALDPLPESGNQHVQMTNQDLSTLLALGISHPATRDAPLAPELWDLLLQKPPMYVRLPVHRKTLL